MYLDSLINNNIKAYHIDLSFERKYICSHIPGKCYAIDINLTVYFYYNYRIRVQYYINKNNIWLYFLQDGKIQFNAYK